MSPADLVRGAVRALRSSRRRTAGAWALAGALALAALGGGPGISRDEAAVLARAEDVPAAGARSGPPLAPAAARATHALGVRAGLPHLRAFRLGAALAGALLSALIALAAWEIAGPAGALLAPALFWLAPRHLHAGLVATPDILLAALFLAAVLAWRRALAATGTARLREAALAGIVLGGALAARPDAWVLLPALAVHAVLLRVLASRAAATAPPTPLRSGGVLAALALAAAVAAVVVALAWPAVLGGGLSTWLSPGEREGRAAMLALLAIPVTLLLAYLGGAVDAAARGARAFRARAAPGPASDDLLLLLAAVGALAGAALAPAPPGARPWLHALPLLAVLGARTLLRAAALTWPSRAAPLAGALALLVLYPGLRAVLRAHPHGTSTWNEAAGGLPGAASRGLPRQDGGDAAAAILAAVNERAREGARVWWAGVAPGAVQAYAREGRLRADLGRADGPEQADLAVVAVESAGRDAEYRAWTALRTARPAAGVYVDEVPVAFVYARAGAWR